MFTKKLFGYDTQEVNSKIHAMTQKNKGQQKDLNYLRNENNKLKNKLKLQSQNDEIENI